MMTGWKKYLVYVLALLGAFTAYHMFFGMKKSA